MKDDLLSISSLLPDNITDFLIDILKDDDVDDDIKKYIACTLLSFINYKSGS